MLQTKYYNRINAIVKQIIPTLTTVITQPARIGPSEHHIDGLGDTVIPRRALSILSFPDRESLWMFWLGVKH